MGIPEAIRSAMQRTNALFNTQVVEGGNIGALDMVYTAGARILPPGAPLIEGREKIKEFWRQAIAGMGIESAKLITVGADQVGDDVLEIGNAELTLANGGAVEVKYVVHWRQEDGAWKWNVDIWNPNQ